jgi:hypothetical protein
MKFTEIVARLTGISCPIFGVSWNPSEAEVTAAKRVISFLEDRRVLYNPTTMEVPSHCAMSVVDIRRFLTEELGLLDPHNELAKNLQAMRAACRKFLDAVQEEESRPDFIDDPVRLRWSLGSWIFLSALGELRAVVGIHVAQIAVRNGLDVESDLASILPAEFENDRTSCN